MRSNTAFSYIARGLVILAVAGLGVSGQAQGQEKFKARLSVIPISGAAGRNNIDAGPRLPATGSVTVTLTGTQLALTGTFENFKSAATMAQIRRGELTGVRGPAVLDLTVTKADKGSITGTFMLTPEQVDLLKKGRLYVQIHSETAPDGALWGWLLK